MPRRPTDHPLVYEINTRVWLRELGVGLADVPDGELERLCGWGVDFVWLMGVWRTGPRGRQIARSEPTLRTAYDAGLPGWTEADVLSSPYAIAGYTVVDELGGPQGLATLRGRLRARGIGLILDFVPNHVALDHPWLADHPDFFVSRPRTTDEPPPGAFEAGDRWIAHGRDPYFAPWTDTAQLDHRHPELRAALVDDLLRIADQCDGVRCDMAMLVLEEVFAGTWSASPAPSRRATGEFWAAAVPAVRRAHPTFLMLGEAYWDTEWRLQQLGFDHLYDKRLYDRLVGLDAAAVRAHLAADYEFQRRLARFVENHDEPRAAATWSPEQLPAALVASLTLPGLRLVHDGQVEGRRRRVPVQLARRAQEPVDGRVVAIHGWLFAALATEPFRRGSWRLRDVPDAADVLAWSWDAGAAGRALCLVNVSPRPARVDLPELPAPVDLSPWDARIYAVS